MLTAMELMELKCGLTVFFEDVYVMEPTINTHTKDI